MRWELANRVDRRAKALADRHYSRTTPGAPQFAPPGRNITLATHRGDAAWVTVWPDAALVEHGLGDAWICTLFRNEGEDLSSDLIREAVAVTRWRWGDPPEGGMVTFIEEAKVATKGAPGYCFLRAGFRYVRGPGGRRRRTKDRHLLVLRLAADRVPPAAPPIGASVEMFAV